MGRLVGKSKWSSVVEHLGFDEEDSSRSIEVATGDMVEKVHGTMLADCRVKIGEVARSVKISIERIKNILYEKIGHEKSVSQMSVRFAYRIFKYRWTKCIELKGDWKK